jgi:hypothetical protein
MKKDTTSPANLTISNLYLTALRQHQEMKILEAQSAQLTNYEVYVHLTEQRERHAKLPKSKGRRPGNFETIVKEVSVPLDPLLDLWLIDSMYSYSTILKKPHLLSPQSLCHTMRKRSEISLRSCANSPSPRPKLS